MDFEEEEKYDAKRLLEEKENTLKRTERVLKKFFKSVELIRGKHYPYKTRCSEEPPFTYGVSKMDYFIVKGPQKNLYEKTCECFNKIIEDRFRFSNIFYN